MKQKAAFYVLGCKVNQHEAEALRALFRRAGYEIVDFKESADVYVIHTCTVTHLGDSKSRQMIRRAVRRNPEAVVAVTGCYAQVSPDEVCAIPGVDLIIGTQDRGRIVELVDRVARERVPLNLVRDVREAREFEELPLEEISRVRAFLKIQEGCRQFCSYCIVPFARGPVRSRHPDRTIEEVERLVRAGYKEFVLTGVHIGSYGVDLPGGVDLAGLVRRLVDVPGLARLRISSLDPNEFTPELVDVLAGSPVICPHFHIPLQSGEDEVLRRMRRRYTTADYTRVLQELRDRNPDLAITTDIIVGFPGETEAQFERTYRFAKEMAFAGIHVFKYSPRAGTPAAGFPDQVPHPVKETRSNRLLELARKLTVDYAAGFLGRDMEVLVEQEVEPGGGLWEGHTGNYLRVVFPGNEGKRGQLVPVRLLRVNNGYVEGTFSDR
ncbi:RNA modification enzyme MiaB [Clostridiales bacterium PH28_bin88]|nr:RNA modification enzyme MiaB [Clostridiales bacterium PH28_bin88]